MAQLCWYDVVVHDDIFASLLGEYDDFTPIELSEDIAALWQDAVENPTQLSLLAEMV